MKRTLHGVAADALHPSLAFHREVLTVQQWSAIRREFLAALEQCARNHDDNNKNNKSNGNSNSNNNNNDKDSTAVVCWNEPARLWRHSQEALGKWVLAQVARLPASCSAVTLHEQEQQQQQQQHEQPSPQHGRGQQSDSGNDSGSNKEQTTATRAVVVRVRREVPLGMFAFASPQAIAASRHTDNNNNNNVAAVTYDEQLVRDLSLKSNAAHDAAALRTLRDVVARFALSRRCAAAYATIEAAMQCVTPHTAAVPTLRYIAADDEVHRTRAQQRIRGAIAEIGVSWRTTTTPSSSSSLRDVSRTRRDCPVVSLPWPVYTRLCRCYAHFARHVEHADMTSDHTTTTTTAATAAAVTTATSSTTTSTMAYANLTRDACMLRRVATVALRYEGALATGSLQLCADTALKRHLHACGYHVVDACASPINAYMGTPVRGRYIVPCTTPTHAPQREHAPQEQRGVDTDTTQQCTCETTHNNNNNNNSNNSNSCSCCTDAADDELPNVFCSAFADTDVFFGSVGSALHVDPFMLQRVCCAVDADGQEQQRQQEQRPLLLTLDVPYDEDLCELLLCKLSRDMRRATALSCTHGSCRRDDNSTHMSSPSAQPLLLPPSSPRVDYVLVLPLWWQLDLNVRKRVFVADAHAASQPQQQQQQQQQQQNKSDNNDGDDVQARLSAALTSAVAAQTRGHVLTYTWPTQLAAAAATATHDSSTTSRRPHDKLHGESSHTSTWVCFDGVFLGDSYAYYCSATNRQLPGVTSTEVVGLAQPCIVDDSNSNDNNSDSSMLARALCSFYDDAKSEQA